MQRDGACLFQAVDNGYRKLRQNKEPPLDLRTITIERIQSDRTTYDPLIKAEISTIIYEARTNGTHPQGVSGLPAQYLRLCDKEHSTDVEVETFLNNPDLTTIYLQLMKNSRAWGGAIELGVLAKILNIQIILYKTELHCVFFVVFAFSTASAKGLQCF